MARLCGKNHLLTRSINLERDHQQQKFRKSNANAHKGSKEAFRKNLEFIRNHNSKLSGVRTASAANGNQSWPLHDCGINEYSDMDPKEFIRRFTGFVSGPRDQTKNMELPDIDANFLQQLPESFDWVSNSPIQPTIKQSQYTGRQR